MSDVARKQLIAGNWKMNLTYSEGVELVRKLASILPDGIYDRVDIAVLPPFTHIRAVQAMLSA